jgi:hypothetical protein
MEPLAADRMVAKARPGKWGRLATALYEAGENALIKRFQDSPYAHVGIYGGVDPETGKHLLIHSAGAPLHDSFRIEPIDRFLADRRMQILQQDFSPEERQAIEAYARGPMREGSRRYSDRNFRAAALPQLERMVENNLISGGLGKVPGIGAVSRPAGRGIRALLGRGAEYLGEHCEPGEGTCGAMALQTRAHVRGMDEAERVLGAGTVRPGHGEWSVSPGTIGKSSLKVLGQYEPKDMEKGIWPALVKAVRKTMGRRAK